MNWDLIKVQLDLLPDYLGNHLLLSMAALSIGIVICLPTAIAVTRVKRLQWPTLAFASVMQTIPGIALLALMVPLLGMIGFLPALIALVLYSMLPILRNGVTGIIGVDPALTEAARGIGMSSRQMLMRVELPLAAPVIIAGVRTSAVWVIGTTTLATPVGATSLGNYIFGGLQTQNTVAVLVGCIAAALLAIILDQLIRLMEVAAEKRSGKLAVLGGVLILILIGGGLTPMFIKAGETGGRQSVIIGAKTFTEQFILSDVIAAELEEAGFPVEVRSSLGSIVLFEALVNGNVDLYVDYTGTIWANAMNRDTILSGEETYREMKQWLEEKHGIVTVGRLGFENAYALAMTEDRSSQLGIETISQMVPHAESLSIGSDYEFFARPEWKSLQRIYNISFGQQRAFDPSLMYRAVREGQVDVITAFTTDGRIIAYNLAVIDDDKDAFPPYDAVLLMSSKAAQRSDLIEALQPLMNAIGDREMRQANKIVDVDKEPIQEAVEYLRERISDQ